MLYKNAISQKLTIHLIVLLWPHVALKKDLLGRKFKTDDELNSAVLEHFEGKPPKYFSWGFIIVNNRCE
jgi:hypothetical protein